MHQNLAKSGVHVISISVDDKDDEKIARKFLVEQKAAFPNFLLTDDEPMKKEWKYDSVPFLIVIDREGNIAKAFPGEAKVDEIDQFVKGLLKGK